MKKVISLFLTVVMAFSMFSCLSVLASAESVYLAVDQENIIPHDTYATFVPEESGFYRFASNGYGDPRISFHCLNGEYYFDDQNGTDFCGVAKLEAGEEVRCYLYNYSGEDCVFTITKVKAPESVSVDLAEPLEIIKEINGYWCYDSIWNSEEGVYEERAHFIYYDSFQWYEGNTITLNYADGTSDVYTCNYDGGNYYNSSGEALDFNYYSDQSCDNIWTIGSDNYLTVEVMGAKTQIPVTVIENPVESIEFTPYKPYEFIENMGGCFEDFYNHETGEWETAYVYGGFDVNRNDNILTVNYTDGTSEEYVFTNDGRYGWYDSEGEKLKYDYVSYYHYQAVNPWTVDGDNYIVVEYLDSTTQVPVTIIENPVESIEFTPAEPYEFIENTKGYYEDCYNSETGEWETRYFYDRYNIWEEGNILTVNYNNGTSVDYTYSYEYDAWCDAEGNKLEYDYPNCYDYQSINPWTAGGDNYIVIKYMDREVQVPVTIVENPYESVSFEFADPQEIIENITGYMDTDYIWNEETDREEWVEYFRYYTPGMYNEGNTITLNRKDGTKDVYICDDSGEYLNSSGKEIEFQFDGNQGYNNQWSLGSDNYIDITIPTYGLETKIPVTIVENPYVSIEFVPADGEALTVDQYTNGEWFIDESGTYYRYYYYSVACGEGNVIKATRNDGTVEVYIGDTNGFYNEDYDYIDHLTVDTDDPFWTVDGENVITITAFGNSCEVNVEVIENTSVIYENKFVAEKVSDDSCIITKINNFAESHMEVVTIPETIDGYKVIGMDDGALNWVWGLQELNLPSGFNMISENLFSNVDSLKAVNVSEDNQVFASVNGILYNKALTEIIYCPVAFTGEFIIKAGVTELSPSVLAFMVNASNIVIESGNTSFAIEDDILYNADFTKIYKAFSTDADYVMKSTVKEIADYSFRGNEQIESVKFSAGVTEIAYEAFAGCSALASVDLPESLVGIGERAFANTALTGVDLPDTTKNIEKAAFVYCSSLKEVELNEGLERLGDSVFYRADIGKVDLPDSLTEMGSGCFAYNVNLSSATIGSGLTAIPASSFDECYALESIDIPENITVIGEWAFYGTGLKTISLHDKITKIDRAFMQCDNLTEVYVVDNIESMNGAFAHCDGLTYAYVGSGVRSMESAFSGCENLETVEIAEGISCNCDWAFSGCSKLSEINLPSTVTELSYSQFSGCESLESIDIPDHLYKVEGYALRDTGWYNNQNTGDVYLEHVLYDYKGNMPSEYTLKIKDGTKSIADAAYEDENNLVKVEIPEGFKYIGDRSFLNCPGLTSITIPESVEYIGDISLGYKRRSVKYDDFVIYGVKNTAANKYADENGFRFIAIEHPHTESEWIVDKEATCTEAGSKHKECVVCKDIVETVGIPAKGHTEVVDAPVEATCTATGLTEGKHCSVCNAVIKAQETVAAKGHTEVVDAAVEATCTETGLTAGSHCSVCNVVIKAQETVAAKGHTEVVDAAVEATCTETGLTAGSHCSVCNAVIKAQETVPAKGHTSSDWIIDKEATCTESGSKHKECTVCKVVLETVEILATGHTAGDWKTDKEATVYKAGKKVKKCTVCGETVETGTIKQLKCDKPSLKKIENTADGVKLTWDKVEGADKYEVYYRKGSKGKYTKLGTTSKNYVTHKKAVSGNKYYYYVKAVNEAGASSASKSKSIYYLADPTLKTPKSTKSGIVLKWNKITGADGYMVYRKTGSGSYSKIATVKGNSKVTYTDKSAKKGKTYTYKIKAYKSKTSSALSNAKKIKDKY